MSRPLTTKISKVGRKQVQVIEYLNISVEYFDHNIGKKRTISKKLKFINKRCATAFYPQDSIDRGYEKLLGPRWRYPMFDDWDMTPHWISSGRHLTGDKLEAKKQLCEQRFANIKTMGNIINTAIRKAFKAKGYTY